MMIFTRQMTVDDAFSSVNHRHLFTFGVSCHDGVLDVFFGLWCGQQGSCT